MRFAFYAGLGIGGVALLINCLSWFDVPLINGALALFALIFPLWFGAIFAYLRYLKPSGRSQTDVWKPVFDGVPTWLRTTAFALIAYVFINFFASIALLPGQPEQTANGYEMVSHGDVVKLTYQEYVHAQAVAARLFSGHTALFALAAAGIFRAALRRITPPAAAQSAA
jgi:hypothetical protein